MRRKAITYNAPSGQTVPQIYVEKARYSPGSTSLKAYSQWVITLVTGGYCRHRIGGQDFVSSSGVLLLIRPQTLIYNLVIGSGDFDGGGQTAGQDWSVIAAMFHPNVHWQAWLDDMEYDRGLARFHLTGPARGKVEKALLRLTAVYNGGGLLRDDKALNALEYVLITLREHVINVRSPVDSRVRLAVEFIYAHYGEKILVADIAGSVGLSDDHLSALFMAAIGMSAAQYLEHVRLGRAAEMLRFSQAGIKEIAAATGYAEQNYLARRFRLRYGMAPNQYRKANHAELESGASLAGQAPSDSPDSATGAAQYFEHTNYAAPSRINPCESLRREPPAGAQRRVDRTSTRPTAS